MKRLLMVDGENTSIRTMQQVVSSMQGEYSADYARTGQEALQCLARGSYNAVVVGMHLPGIPGLQLLDYIRKEYPDTIRFGISSDVNQQTSLKAASSVHQFLPMTTDAEELKISIQRALNLNELLRQVELKKLVTRLTSLPSLPNLYVEIMQEIQSPSSSLEKIGAIIARDPGMTAKILQLVNSAFFGLNRSVSSPVQATVYLGMEVVRGLVLSQGIFSQFSPAKLDRLNIGTLWEHCFAVAIYSREIARMEGLSRNSIDFAFTAGILHDVGQLVLADNLTMAYYSTIGLAGRRGIELYIAEKEVFGATHSQVGAYLLGLWGLPQPIVEAVAFHNSPMDYFLPGISTVTVVAAANFIEHEIKPKPWSRSLQGGLEKTAAQMGFQHRLADWRETCKNISSRVPPQT